jgi:hypothetical protein
MHRRARRYRHHGHTRQPQGPRRSSKLAIRNVGATPLFLAPQSCRGFPRAENPAPKGRRADLSRPHDGASALCSIALRPGKRPLHPKRRICRCLIGKCSEQFAEKPTRHDEDLVIHFIISNRWRRACEAHLWIRADCFRTFRRRRGCEPSPAEDPGACPRNLE